MVFLCEGQSARGSITNCRECLRTATKQPGRLHAQGPAAQRVEPQARARHRGPHRRLALRQGHPRHRRRRGRPAYPQPAHHVFLQVLRALVDDGHLHVIETPLFRVRNKQDTIYCYSEAERDAAAAKPGGKPEITRFKRLGVKSPRASSSNSSAGKCARARWNPRRGLTAGKSSPSTRAGTWPGQK